MEYKSTWRLNKEKLERENKYQAVKQVLKLWATLLGFII